MPIRHTQRMFLPRTGQTTSYRVGDNGYFQAGNPRATRFVDNGNGTISDRHTGLTWVKQPELIIPGAVGVHSTNQIQRARATWKVPPDDGLGDYIAGDLVVGDGAPDALFYVCILGHTAHADYEPPNATYWRETVWTASAANLTTPATMAWNDAIDYCLGAKWDAVNEGGAIGLNYAGYDDWRLSNSNEFINLPLVSGSSWAVSNTQFPNMKAGGHWLSDAFSADESDNSVTSYQFKYVIAYAIASLYYVRPVRGGRHERP